MSFEQRLHIAAGGPSSRLRPYMDQLGYPAGDSKHLMVTGNPDDEVLLGRIVRTALKDNIPSVVHTNHANYEAIVKHSDLDPTTTFVPGGEPDTAFGPFIRPLLQTGELTLGAAGDQYVENFSWADFLAHHDSGKYPFTLVAALCAEVDEGAAFDIADDGRVNSFRRMERTTSENLINIGIYAFEAPQVVQRALANLGVTRETVDPLLVTPDVIVQQMIEKGLVGAYVLPPNTAFNVNTPETYNALLRHTSVKSPAIQPV